MWPVSHTSLGWAVNVSAHPLTWANEVQPIWTSPKPCSPTLPITGADGVAPLTSVTAETVPLQQPQAISFPEELRALAISVLWPVSSLYQRGKRVSLGMEFTQIPGWL